MTDFWGGLADRPQAEEEQGFQEVPPKKWCLAKTVADSTSGASADIREFPPKGDREHSLYMFAMGVIVTGGEKSLDEKYDGRYVFFNAWVHPFKDDDADEEETKVISGRLLGSLNAIFSPGVGDEFVAALGNDADDEEKREAKAKRSDARWKHTLGVLQAAGEMAGITQEQYKDGDGEVDFGLMIAACAVEALKDNAKQIIVRTRTDKRKRGDEETKETVVGGIYDLTEEEYTKRGIRVFDNETVIKFDAPKTTF